VRLRGGGVKVVGRVDIPPEACQAAEYPQVIG